MSFRSPRGTRGARLPAAWTRLLNSRLTNQFRRKGGTYRGVPVLVLITVGARSGAERSATVCRFPGDDGSWLIAASASGARRNPAWYHNIAANPDRIRAVVDGREVAVTAAQLCGTDRDEAWRRIVAEAAFMAAHQDRTDRVLPIIRLVAR